MSQDLDEFNVDSLDNRSLKNIFYKIHIVDMSDYDREQYREPQRGIIFDYFFLQMPYSELVQKAVEIGYPNPERLPVDIIPF